ncbi:MAG: MOSC domain-containing protein, partial [Steroidobacteraceae bacterium]
CDGIDAGDAAADWASRAIGTDCRVLRFDPRRARLSPAQWTGDIAAPNQFSDGFPLLVVNRASLEELNGRLGVPLPMNRFRPNLVLDGLAPWDEDRIGELAIGEVRLRLVKPCTRCSITTIDQQDGTPTGQEPLQTLRSYRFDAALRGILFGVNAIIVAGVGATLAAGAEVTVGWK